MRFPSATKRFVRCSAHRGFRVAEAGCTLRFDNSNRQLSMQCMSKQSFGCRSFSSTSIPGVLADDRIFAASPTEAGEKAIDLATAESVDYSSLGDLGYGLSDLALRSLDLIHATTGLPWWATIVATTVAVRTVFFPITVISMRNAAKMKRFQPDMEKLRAEMEASPTKDPESVKAYQKKYKALMKKHNVNPFKSFLTPFVQIPVFLGFFWGLQDIAKYFPEYKEGGIGWFPDLSAPDPTMALPVISSTLLLASVELSGDAMTGEMKKNMGIFVYWVTSNMFTLTQTALLRLHFVKRALNIPVTEVVRLERSSSIASSFEAAVARARKDTLVKTHMYKPTKLSKQK
ncbi:hypothetical protein PsorP6_013863 [Peronosclerospora sorghi]|uniref:Uncharacterized protein n=1 Tax=Peronosclerospora sorghi TaxID=230839 RepID=A0ACC0VJ43_9STRA|nr:hypothetical protein PsorP6_013863 [Peronosclerospora sorghi]